MKYAIITNIKKSKRRYLVGFTNTPINEEKEEYSKYTIELRELDSIFIPLEGDAAIYLQ